MTSTTTTERAVRAFYGRSISKLCPTCLGREVDEQFNSTCVDCGTVPADVVRVDYTNEAPESHEGAATSSESTTTREFGWTKVDGVWCALAPKGTIVPAAGTLVELVTKAGKRTTVVLGEKVKTLSFGTAYRFTDAPVAAPAQPAQEPAPAAPAAPAAPQVRTDLSGVPSGTYMLPGQNGRLEVRNVTDGKWAGWVFCTEGSEYSTRSGARLGSAKPGQAYVGKWAEFVAAVAADPKAAAIEFAARTGCCALCGRTLEDAESVARGMGPVCARKF